MTGRHILSFLLIIILTGSFSSRASTVKIYGINPGYKGLELEFYIYPERIFNSTKSLCKTKVDSAGIFSVNFSIEKTQCVYFNTPLYTAFVFVEPGKSYQVELPPLPASTSENSKNPFFIAPLWHLLPIAGSDNKDPDLNSLIYSFNQHFEPFLDKQILRYYDPHQSRAKLDSFIVATDKMYQSIENEYFQSYKLYKLASLGFMVNQFSSTELYEKYIKGKAPCTEIPSWWEFYNLYFDGYFSSLSTRKEFSGLYQLVGNGSYFALNQLLLKDPVLQNNSIREWLILKELHNAYYQNSLPLSTVTAICDSLTNESSDSLTISMASILLKEAGSLLLNNLPPSASLMNANGDSIDISLLRGKYNYVGFCSLDNLGCQKEFEYLKYFYHKHGKYLNLVIVLPSSEKNRIPSYTDENSIPWEFWYSLNDTEILKDFKVRAYPVFYLLNREGKLIMSPASLPSAGFEQQLFNILKGRGEI